MDIQKLRQKVLDLAIRGKLVPQDPNDEPASELLKRIRKGKDELIKAGKIKKDKRTSFIFKGDDNSYYEKKEENGEETTRCIDDEIPFEIPNSWAWTRLGDVCLLNPKNVALDSQMASFVPMNMINDGNANHFEYEERTWGEIKNGYTHFANGDVAFAKITPCFENKKSVIFHDLRNGIGAGTTELFILRPYSDDIQRLFLLFFLKRDDFINNGVSSYKGAVGQQRVSSAFVKNTLFPLPPLNEQIKILHTLEDVVGSCDYFDVSEHRLTALVALAKSKLLELAIRGKLLPQDPNDEPASELLKRIREGKRKASAVGKSKKAKPESCIFKGDDNLYYEQIGSETHCIQDEIPFEIPKNWAWTRLKDVCSEIRAGGDKPKNYSKNKTETCSIPIYSNGIEQDGLYGFTDTPLICEEAITVSARGTIGFPFVRKHNFVPIIRLISIIPERNIVCIMYLYWLIYFLRPVSEGSSIPQLTVPSVSKIVIPLPPLNEQLRILKTLNTLSQNLDLFT